MAVKTAGVPLATTSIAVVGAATARWGWRPALAVLGVIAAVAAFVALRRFPTGGGGQLARRHRAALPRWFWQLPIAAFCTIAGSQPLYSWFATYLHEALGMATGTATLVSGVCTATGIPAMIVAARISDRLGAAWRAYFLGGLGAVCAAALVVVLGAPTLGVATAVVAVAIGAAANLSFAGLFPALIAECAPRAVEHGTGVAMTGYFLGALLSPVGFGALADTTGGYPLAWSTASIVSLVGALLFVIIGRTAGRQRQVQQTAADSVNRT
jgi:CP family cyanate transporter-like MFS transporter